MVLFVLFRINRIQGYQYFGQSNYQGTSEAVQQMADLPSTLHRGRTRRRQRHPPRNA